MDFDYNYDNHLANKMAGKNIRMCNISEIPFACDVGKGLN